MSSFGGECKWASNSALLFSLYITHTGRFFRALLSFWGHIDLQSDSWVVVFTEVAILHVHLIIETHGRKGEADLLSTLLWGVSNQSSTYMTLLALALLFSIDYYSQRVVLKCSCCVVQRQKGFTENVKNTLCSFLSWDRHQSSKKIHWYF